MKNHLVALLKESPFFVSSTIETCVDYSLDVIMQFEFSFPELEELISLRNSILDNNN